MKRCTEQLGGDRNLNQAIKSIVSEMKKMDEVIKGIKIEMKVHDDVRQRIGNYTKEMKQDIRKIGKL